MKLLICLRLRSQKLLVLRTNSSGIGSPTRVTLICEKIYFQNYPQNSFFKGSLKVPLHQHVLEFCRSCSGSSFSEDVDLVSDDVEEGGPGPVPGSQVFRRVAGTAPGTHIRKRVPEQSLEQRAAGRLAGRQVHGCQASLAGAVGVGVVLQKHHGALEGAPLTGAV